MRRDKPHRTDPEAQRSGQPRQAVGPARGGARHGGLPGCTYMATSRGQHESRGQQMQGSLLRQAVALPGPVRGRATAAAAAAGRCARVPHTRSGEGSCPCE